MIITYDKSKLIAGIALYPWTRLGPENWFKDYKIIAAHGWDLPVRQDNIELLSANITDTAVRKTQQFIETDEFKTILFKLPSGYKLIPYKPVKAPGWCDNVILQNDPKFTENYENKKRFRESFDGLLPFAQYRVLLKTSLKNNKDYFSELLNGQSKIVIQDELLSGGRGTHLISTYEEYDSFFSSTAFKEGGESVVMSSFIPEAKELSLQCVATRYGTITSLPQQQYVREEKLCKVNISSADKFCGGQVAEDLVNDEQAEQLTGYAKLIGDKMYSGGYRGIFGVDLLLGQDDRVYVLEVNARVTGLTPLYNVFSGTHETPFNLLHVLELANADYEIQEDSEPPKFQAKSLMMYHALIDEVSKVSLAPNSGTYAYDSTGLKLLSRQISFDYESTDSMLLHIYPRKDDIMNPGDRLCAVYLPFAAKSPSGHFTDEAAQIIEHLNELFIFTKC